MKHAAPDLQTIFAHTFPLHPAYGGVRVYYDPTNWGLIAVGPHGRGQSRYGWSGRYDINEIVDCIKRVVREASRINETEAGDTNESSRNVQAWGT